MYRPAVRTCTPHIRACHAPNARLLSALPRLGFSHDDYVGSTWSRRAQLNTENLAFSGRRINSSLASPLRPLGDTIYALSSGQGRAGVAVIRVSGPHCQDVYHALCPGQKDLPTPRYAVVRSLQEPGSWKGDRSAVLDSAALVLYFPGPRTVTGEDVLEFHVHGGPATVKAVLAGIGRSVHRSGGVREADIRYAEPGEFTKRAFLNNRLDLAQVESLSDTLAAETEQQRRAAVRGNSGKLGRTYESWRQLLLHARAELEALIDFSEDQHFDESPAELLRNVHRSCEDIVTRVRLHEMGSQKSELLRGGIQIALLGPPNVGKSSLMNLIVGREASIVSSEPGTTRDIVETSLDIGGYLCSFADTAGIRSQSDSEIAQVEGNSSVVGAIEQEGIRRAKARAEDSDVIVAVASFEKNSRLEWFVQYDDETLKMASNAKKCLIVVNKADRVSASEKEALIGIFATRVHESYPTLQSVEILSVSCRYAGSANAGTGIDQGGLQAVIDRIKQAFASMTSLPPEMADLLGVTERQRQLLVKCLTHLEEFLEQAEQDEPDVVIAAEHLRSAAVYLARITGRGEGGDIEEVLGVIFEKFCVGK